LAEENENENESELEENIPEVSDELEDAAAESDPENEGEDAGDESAQLEVEEEEPGEPVDCPPCKSGSPAWMATFADMATLLMAFFCSYPFFCACKCTQVQRSQWVYEVSVRRADHCPNC